MLTDIVPEFLTTIELACDLSVTDTLRRFQDCPFVILLDSAGQIRQRDARYSFLTADPVDTVRLDCVKFGDDPFAQLREWQQRLPSPSESSAPFCGGIAGMMSYELGHAFEILPRPGRDDFCTPALLAGLFDWAIVWDHVEHRVKLHVLHLLDAESQTVSERIEWVLERLNADFPPSLPFVDEAAMPPEISGTCLPDNPHVMSSFSR